jgi:hypothetical protein
MRRKSHDIQRKTADGTQGRQLKCVWMRGGGLGEWKSSVTHPGRRRRRFAPRAPADGRGRAGEAPAEAPSVASGCRRRAPRAAECRPAAPRAPRRRARTLRRRASGGAPRSPPRRMPASPLPRRAGSHGSGSGTLRPCPPAPSRAAPASCPPRSLSPSLSLSLSSKT